MRPRLSIVAVSLAAMLGILLLGTVNYLEPIEVGLTWNPLTGERGLQSRAGWHLTPPWVMESTVNTSPERLCLTSAAHSAVNCRLVQFVPEHYRDFLEVEGFRLEDERLLEVGVERVLALQATVARHARDGGHHDGRPLRHIRPPKKRSRPFFKNGIATRGVTC